VGTCLNGLVSKLRGEKSPLFFDFFQKELDKNSNLWYNVVTPTRKGTKTMNDMKVNVICDGRKGSEKNPASIAIILHLPNNNGGYSRFYADVLYSNELKEWYFSRMNHCIDEKVILKHLFNDELMFSRKVCNRINKIWKNKKW
jgi:hypothetical protein